MSPRLVPASLLAVAVVLAAGSVRAQAIVPLDASGFDEDPGVSFPQDRTAIRRLRMAQDRIAGGNYQDAVPLLSAILDLPEDSFYRPENTQSVYVSIKAEAGRLLAQLPAEARKQFVVQHEAAAKKALEAALADGDLAAAAQVMTRYVHTPASYHAALIVAGDHLDHGRPLAAALCLRRLELAPTAEMVSLEPTLSLSVALAWRRAGMPEIAAERLGRLQSSRPNLTLPIGGSDVPLFAGDPLAVLARFDGAAAVGRPAPAWPVSRGNAARSGVGSLLRSPLLHRWEAGFYDDFLDVAEDERCSEIDRGVTELLAESSLRLRQEGKDLPFPVAQPLVVRDLVIARSAAKIVALDAATGRRRWEAAVDPELQSLLRAVHRRPSSASAEESGLSPADLQTPPALLRRIVAQGLVRRVWHDITYGTLSSDGQRVFAVEDLPFRPDVIWEPDGLHRVDNARRKHNRLAAYSISREGSLAWEVGGPDSEQGIDPKAESAKTPHEETPDAAGAFFLGPPLPLSGRLYVLAERNAEIRLLELAAATGAVLWSQPLCSTQASIRADFHRQIAGASPAYADGVLVCPTAAGAVVAIDLASRSLLWAFTYRRDESLINDEMPGRIDPVLLDSQRTWLDASPVIVEGRVLLTPPGGHSLYCLGLLDGKPQWKNPAPRDDSLFVAAVDGGNVLLVGRSGVRGLRLADGKASWVAAAYPGRESPAGSGFAHGGDYSLPLTSGALATVDIASGKYALSRPENSQTGAPLRGNLLSVGGVLYVQDELGLSAYGAP
ncbi:MAG: PQQ-binding-like beta-propeller repeat protein [Planctomycetia bacterium]|nr:PQQ-binding-like beta-propeller repeat protein [Planctomycetia bacterium]